jgi:hypothetical protein
MTCRGSPCPRIWQGRRPTAPKMKGSVHENRENGSKVFPGLPQMREGEILSWSPQEMMKG